MTRLFHDFLVRWVQQLLWPSSSLTDVKGTQAVLPKSFLFYLPYWKTEHFPQLKVYHAHLATLPLSILLEEQAHARVQCLARTSVKQFRSLQSPVLKKGRAWQDNLLADFCWSKQFLPAMSFSLIRVLPIEVTMLFLTPPEVLPGIHCGRNKTELVHRNWSPCTLYTEVTALGLWPDERRAAMEGESAQAETGIG